MVGEIDYSKCSLTCSTCLEMFLFVLLGDGSQLWPAEYYIPEVCQGMSSDLFRLPLKLLFMFVLRQSRI